MADLAANLTTTQIDDFRQNWIRDLWVTTPTASGLSEYNRSRKANFFSDQQLQSAHDRIIVDWSEELAAVQYEKQTEREDEGDTEAAAIVIGDNLREQAVFRLMRAWCRRQMLEDPGFRASIAVGIRDPKPIIDLWIAENAADLAWVRSRSGIFNQIEVERG